MTVLLGHDGLVHTSRAFASHHLSRDSHSTPAVAALANYTAMAKLLAAVPAQSTANAMPLYASGSAGWCQDDAVQSETDLVTLPRVLTHQARQILEADKHLNFSQATRRQAVQRFDFLIQSIMGQAFVLYDGHALHQKSWPLLNEKSVELMTAVYGTSCSQVIADPICSNICGTLHTAAFGKAYTAKNLKLCCLHLSALQAMARHKVRCCPQCLE